MELSKKQLQAIEDDNDFGVLIQALHADGFVSVPLIIAELEFESAQSEDQAIDEIAEGRDPE